MFQHTGGPFMRCADKDTRHDAGIVAGSKGGSEAAAGALLPKGERIAEIAPARPAPKAPGMCAFLPGFKLREIGLPGSGVEIDADPRLARDRAPRRGKAE